MTPKSRWEWMPHPGHLMVSRWCRFHLTTHVGLYIVSTVGEYVPSPVVQQICAEAKGIKLEGRGDAREADFLKKHGFEQIGWHRTYETMVFKAKRSGEKCCPYTAHGSELDFEGYNDAGAALKGHLAMCDKYSRLSGIKEKSP